MFSPIFNTDFLTKPYLLPSSAFSIRVVGKGLASVLTTTFILRKAITILSHSITFLESIASSLARAASASPYLTAALMIVGLTTWMWPHLTLNVASLKRGYEVAGANLANPLANWKCPKLPFLSFTADGVIKQASVTYHHLIGQLPSLSPSVGVVINSLSIVRIAIRLAFAFYSASRVVFLPMFLNDILANIQHESYGGLAEIIRELTNSGKEIVYLTTNTTTTRAFLQEVN